ncbi:MAG: NEW3 domain-containing protein [Thermoplasmata archaeon]|nr:NEW3 domain-containing protein [Thermoplasmata archaeon]
MGNNVWYIASLAAGTTVWINITVLVSDIAPLGTLLTNSVTLDYENAAGTVLPQESDSATTVIVGPIVLMDKTAPAFANTGETITYTIAWQVFGTDNATNVYINETYPVGITFVSAVPAPTTGTNVWFLGNLAPGSSGIITITVLVTATVGTLVNTAVLEHSNGFMQMPDITDSAPTQIRNPLIQIVKDGPTEAAPGQIITYTITYDNVGTDWAYDVTITETYPAGVTFISAIPAPTSGNNVWFIGDLAAGASGMIEITVQINLTATGTLVNFVEAEYNNTVGPVSPVNTTSPPMDIVNCQVTLEKEGPAQANTGQTFTYWLNYTNIGSDTAYDVTITETYPAGVTFISAVPPPTSGTNVWFIGTISPGAVGSIAITVSVLPGATGILHNFADVTGENVGGIEIPVTEATLDTLIIDPLLTVTKTGPATAVPGQQITYTITVQNTGTSPALNVWVTDTYPAGFTYVSSSIAPWNLGTGDNIWYFASIAASGSVSFTITVQIPGTADGTYINTAVAEYRNGFRDMTPVTGTWNTVVSGPYMDITKTAPATANEGEIITYTINYINMGSGTAFNVVITETYPAGITFISAIPAPSNPGAGDNIWNIGNLVAGASGTITIQVSVNLGATLLVNNVTVEYQDASVANYQDWAEATTLVAGPLLEIEKTGPATANTGEEITYTITVTNLGTDTAANVVVTETYPAGVTFVSSNPVPSNPGAGDNIWNIGLVAIGIANQVTITITVRVNNNAAGILHNLAVADYTNTVNTPWPPVEATWDTLVIDPTASLSKWAPAYANTGEFITYYLNYSVGGTDSAYNVWINETYPVGITFISAVPAPTSGTNVWNLGTLPIGTSGSIAITVQVTAASGTLVNNANLEFQNGFRQMADVPASATTIIRNPVLTLDKTAPATAVAGQTITYMITIHNSGNDFAYNVIVTEAYPLGVSFVSALPMPTFGNNVWSIPFIAPDGTVIIEITVEIDPTVTWNLVNNVAATWENAAGISLTPLADQATTVIQAPNMSVTKTGPASATYWQTITYTITYFNNGSAPAENVWVIDVLPAGVTLIGAVPSPTVGTSWFIGTVAPGTGASIIVTVRIEPTAPASITNWATLTYENSAAVTFPDEVAQWTTDIVYPMMTLVKTAPATANTGENITYTLTYTNTGTATAHNLVITETYHPGVDFVSAVPAPSVGTNVWWIVTVAPGASFVITITVQVTATSGWVNNTAVLEYTTQFGHEMPDVQAGAPTQVINPLMTLEKTAPSSANRGDFITYTLTYTNIGNDVAYNVTITETYPADVTFMSAIPVPTNSGAGDNIWNIGNVPAGMSVSINITVRILFTAGTSVINRATLEYSNAAGIEQPQVNATAETAVGDPLLTIDKTGPATANIGSLITYTIYYVNIGDGTAYNVIISEDYDPFVTFVSAVPAPSIGNNIWNVGTLSPGEGGWINVTVRVLTGAVVIENWAYADYRNAANVQQLRVSDNHFTGVTGPFLTVAKDGPAMANTGQTITYTITIENLGDAAAENVWVNDTYPAGVTFVSAVPAPVIGSGNATWFFATIAAGATVVITVNVLVQVSAVGILVNTVTVGYENTEGQPWPDVNDTVETLVNDPYVVITKTGPIQTNPGSQITYSITVSNIGPATAYNVTVTETYPALTAFFDATPYPTTGNNVWYIGTLAPNATYVIWVTVNVSMSATVGIANRVTVTYRDAAGQAKPADTAWWNTSIVNPLLVIYKTAPATANPGQNITYTLWVENVGTAWAIDVIVREYYPANVTFVSATIAPYLLFDNVWFIPALAPGDSWSVDITVHISLLATGTLVNNATVTYENEVGTILPVEWDTASTDIISPDLAIVKTAPAEANPGEIITYTVTLTNNGDAPAYNVVVEEIYPAGVTYITATIAPRPLTTNLWDIGTLNPGASWSVTITVQVNTDATGTLINTAIATYYNEAGMAMDPVTIYAITNVTLPQMQFEKTAPATANTGQTVTYSLRYRNVGTDAAYDVTITESYPAGVSFLSSVPAPIFPTDNQWYFATVPADGIWHYINITVLVSTTASGWLLNSATLDYESGVDIARPRLVATALTHIDDPLITMVKTAPQYANSGEAITYSIYYWNNGTADAYNVWINETYPAGVAYQSAIPAPAPANNTWNIGTLAVGASGIITITVTVNANAVGALVNLAICEYDDGSGEPQLPVEATATTTVVDPYLTISKSAPSAANSGQTITYTITILNLGDAPAYNVIVQETYPAGVSYVSYISTGAPTQMSDSVWLFAMIAPGNTVTLTITVIIDANVADGTLLTNTVDASYEDANGELQVPIRDTATTLIEDPILTITKTGSTTAVVGGTITYTVTVTNTGTGWAYNVTVTDSFPASVSFISSTPARNMDGTWTFSQIAAGGTETITITVQVDPLATDSVLTNWAYANYTDAAGQQQPTVSDSCQTVLQGPLMTITKISSVTQANPGQTFTYTITYQNVGLDTAQNVWVVESYPAGVTFVGSVPAPSNPGAGDNLWGLGNLAPGATGTITITVTVNAGFLGMLSNVATIYYNNTANVPQTPVRAMVNVNVINPLMTIEKTGPATSTVGAPVMYTIHYENTGTDTAQNVVITESYPAGTVFVNSNPVPTVPNTIWNIGNVAPGQSGYIFINVTFQANIATHRINNVTLGYENLAGIAQPTVWDTVDTLVPIPATPLLAVSKTAPATASVSEIIMYTITVTNIGTVGAIGVTVTESYDPSVTFVNATPAPSVPNTIWNVGNLAASASYVIYVNVSVNVGASGTLVNNVTVSYTGQPNEYAEAYTDVIGPAMSVYKSAPAMFGPTGNMVYTITYENTGTDTAYNVVITETYPGLVTFFSAVPAPDVPTDNVWTIASVPAGGVGTITINVVVAALAGSSLVNSVTLDYETAGGYSLPQESASATTLISQVIMTITKTAPLSANPGDTIEYVITIQNPSLFDAVNVLVTETFPALTTVVGLPIYGIIAPDIATPNTWFYNTIPAGQGTTITLFILIDPTATGTLVNNVQMDYTDNLANSFTIYARASTTVSGPMLQIQKTAPATASPGALLLYTITVTNIGPGIAANVVVTETYPSQVIFISSTPAPSNLLTGANIWNLGSINPGQTRIITITVRAIPSAFGTAVNRVAASYQALNGTALPDVYASASTVFAGPSMTVSKTGPEEINPGQTFMYTITYRNIGSGQASNVRIQDVYPAGLTPTASSVTWASHDVGNRRITWNLGTVAAGATVSLTVTFTATGVSVGTFLTNTAYLNYTNGAGAQLPTQISSFVTRVTDAVMTIDKTGPANANSGQYIEYVITYFNSGNAYALNVIITESYPVGVTFDSSIPAPSVGNNVWNIASVAPGTDGSITVRVIVNTDVPSDTMLNNTATLDYRNAAGTVRPQVQDSAITTVLDPLLSIVKNATATTVNNGTVSYTINVTNIGMANAENVVVTENYPAEVTFIFATVTPSFGSNVWLIGTLTPGESWLVTITVMVTSYVQGNIVNFAYADYEDAAREPQTQVSANATTFVADPMLVITKTASPTVSVGGTILYEITLENIGQGDAYNVVLTDIYALGTTFLNSSEMPDGPSNDTWTLPVIPAGWYGTLFINVTVSNGSVGTLVNTALVDYEDVAGNTKPQLMAEAMTRIVSPLLTISKTGPATAYHGEVITYTVTIRNIGDGNATGISVADLYPSWLTYVSSSVPPTFDDYIWNFTVLAPGENITFTVSARLGNYSTNVILTAVMNRVFAYYSNEGGIPQDFVSANFRTSVIRPQLTVEKTGPVTAPSGATIQYTISYTNIGDGWASLITLTETYPAGTAFVSAVPAPTSGNNVWTFANMAPGQSGTIVVTLTVTASFGTSILNTVNLQYRNLIGQAFPAVSATWTTMITGGIEQQPPMVTSIPLDFVWAGEEFVLSGTVISFDNANIVTVILYFTNIDGTQWSAEMSPYDISANRSGIYRLADNRTMQPYKGFVSYFIWVEDSNGNENRSGIYDIPVRLPPYFVWGTIYSAQKESRVTDAIVQVTDQTTFETVIAITDGNGIYQVDLATLYSGYMHGEALTVNATDGLYYGGNSSAVIDLYDFDDSEMEFPNRQVDVILSEIPEFTAVVLPIIAVLVLVVLFRRKRRKTENAASL